MAATIVLMKAKDAKGWLGEAPPDLSLCIGLDLHPMIGAVGYIPSAKLYADPSQRNGT